MRIRSLGLLILLCGCRPAVPVPVVVAEDGTVLEQPPAPDEKTESEAQALASQAEGLVKEGSTEQAQKIRDQLIKEYPATVAGAEEFHRRARVADRAGNAEEAIAMFERVLFYRPDYEKANEVRDRYASLLLDAGRNKDAAVLLDALYQNAKTDEDRKKYGPRLSEVLERTHQWRKALELRMDMVERGIGDTKNLQRETIAIAGQQLPFQDAQELWDDHQGNKHWEPVMPTLSFKLAKTYYHVREYEACEKMLEQVIAKYGSSQYGKAASKFLDRFKAQFAVEPKVVGVILPLSGRFRLFGERTLEAIKLVFHKSTPYKLVVKDSAGSPINAAKAVEELVFEDNVIAILGTMFSKEAVAAATKAEELSVPLISLSFHEPLPDVGPNVFRTALTVSAQAKALAHTAFETLGFSSFAILYPETRYGKTFVDAFWDEVEKRKGEIRGLESYEHDQTTFQQSAKKIVGRYYLLARYEYNRKRAELVARRLPSHRLDAAMEKYIKNLPPIVDFDAIVIPDAATNVGLIAPALAFEDIVMDRDPEVLERIAKATGNDNIKPITLLGASTWNTPKTLEHCEKYCENAVFVDAYFPAADMPRVRKFSEQFQKMTGAEASLNEAQAYDTARIVRNVLNTYHPQSRKDFRSHLQQVSDFVGVTGTIRFTENGDVTRDMYTLTIREGTIQKWRPLEEIEAKEKAKKHEG